MRAAGLTAPAADRVHPYLLVGRGCGSARQKCGSSQGDGPAEPCGLRFSPELMLI